MSNWLVEDHGEAVVFSATGTANDIYFHDTGKANCWEGRYGETSRSRLAI